MVIEKLEIQGFGKLYNLVIRLQSGLNVIYGGNEAGKSSIQRFIKSMFYGLRGGRALKEEAMPPLKRFKPWKGDDYGGSIEYSLDSGERCRIERDFSRNLVRVYDGLFNDITDSFAVSRESGVKFAEKHLGMSKGCFERTVFIGQASSAVDEEGKRELLNRLSNLSQTGQEDISFRKAEKALKEALKNYVGTGRTSVRPLDNVLRRLEELKSQKAGLIEKRKILDRAEGELHDALAGRDCLETEKSMLEALKGLLDIRDRMEELGRRKISLREALMQIEADRRELDRLNSEYKCLETRKETLLQLMGSRNQDMLNRRARAAGYLAAAFFAVAAVFAVLGAVYDKLGYAGALAAIAAALVLLITGRRKRKASSGFEQIRQELSEVTRACGDRMHRTMELSGRIRDRLSRCSLVYGEHIGSMEGVSEALLRTETEYNSLSGRFGRERARILARINGTTDRFKEEAANTDEEGAAALIKTYRLEQGMPASELLRLEALWEKDCQRVGRELEEAGLKVREYETILRSRISEGDELQRVEEELASLEAKKKQLNDTCFSIETALEVLNESALELQKNFVPALNDRLGRIIHVMSGGKYCELKADSALSLKVIAPETGAVTDVMALSGGTVDQVYFALRLCAAELFEGDGEKLPLVMDEAFAQYDDARTREAFRFLNRQYPDRQIIFLTCKDREVDIAREIFGDEFNLICLDGT